MDPRSDAVYVPLLGASEQHEQQQPLPASLPSPRPSTAPGTAAATNSQALAGAANRLANLVRRPSPASGASAGSGALLDPKAPRSRSTGKPGQRPLADGRMAPRNNLRLPSQMPAQLRQKDKLVLLPRSASEMHEADAVAAAGHWGDAQRQLSGGEGEFAAQQEQQPASSLFVDLSEVLPDSRGRVTVYCIAESLDRDILESLVACIMPDAVLTSHAEVLHLSLPAPYGSASAPSSPADCFFFGEPSPCQLHQYGSAVYMPYSVVARGHGAGMQGLACSHVHSAAHMRNRRFFANARSCPSTSATMLTLCCVTLSRVMLCCRLWCGVLLGPDSQAGAGNPHKPGQEGTTAATPHKRGRAQHMKTASRCFSGPQQQQRVQVC
jgi:hypothetical protein